MLQTRKSRVIFVTPTTSYEINLTKDQLLAGMEIEEHIVADVVGIIFLFSCNTIFKWHLIGFIFTLIHRFKVTKTSWPPYLYNDLFVAENNCELIAKWKCHIFADYWIPVELDLKGNSKKNLHSRNAEISKRSFCKQGRLFKSERPF